MNYTNQISELNKEIGNINTLSLEEVQVMYDVDTREEAIALLQEEIQEIESRIEDKEISNYTPIRYYHYLEM